MMSDETRVARVEKIPVAMTERGVQLRDIGQLARFSTMVATSRQFKSWTDPTQICVAVQTGLELGFSPIQSLASLYPTPGGRPQLYGQAALALIRRSPLIEYAKVGVSDDAWDDDEHYGFIKLKRRGEDEELVKFTVEQAKRAGLWMKKTAAGKDSAWVTYSDDMLVWKAVARGARYNCSDILMGIEVAEAQDAVYTSEPSEAPEDHVLPQRPEQPDVVAELFDEPVDEGADPGDDEG